MIEQGAARESLDGYSKVLILFLQLCRLFIFHAEPHSDRLVSLSGLLQHLVQAVVRLVGLVLLARETAQQWCLNLAVRLAIDALRQSDWFAGLDMLEKFSLGPVNVITLQSPLLGRFFRYFVRWIKHLVISHTFDRLNWILAAFFNIFGATCAFNIDHGMRYWRACDGLGIAAKCLLHHHWARVVSLKQAFSGRLQSLLRFARVQWAPVRLGWWRFLWLLRTERHRLYFVQPTRRFELTLPFFVILMRNKLCLIDLCDAFWGSNHDFLRTTLINDESILIQHGRLIVATFWHIFQPFLGPGEKLPSKPVNLNRVDNLLLLVWFFFAGFSAAQPGRQLNLLFMRQAALLAILLWFYWNRILLCLSGCESDTLLRELLIKWEI